MLRLSRGNTDGDLQRKRLSESKLPTVDEAWGEAEWSVGSSKGACLPNSGRWARSDPKRTVVMRC